jgi:hypothetical protein
MSRTTLRTLAALLAVALVAAVPVGATASRGSDDGPRAESKSKGKSKQKRKGKRSSDRHRGDAGKVASFTNGVLTVELAAGGSVSGRVTSRTEIECDDDDHRGRHRGSATASSRGSDDDDRDDDDERRGRGQDDGPDHDAGDDKGGLRGESDDRPATPAPAACGIADLKAGALVRKAELKLTARGATFKEIELAQPAPAPAT